MGKALKEREGESLSNFDIDQKRREILQFLKDHSHVYQAGMQDAPTYHPVLRLSFQPTVPAPSGATPRCRRALP